MVRRALTRSVCSVVPLRLFSSVARLRAGWLAPPAWQSHGDKVNTTAKKSDTTLKNILQKDKQEEYGGRKTVWVAHTR